MRLPPYLGGLAIFVTLVFFGGAVFGPLLALTVRALDFSAWRELFDPGVLSVLKVTLEQAFLSTLLSASLGLICGLGIARVSLAKGPAKWPGTWPGTWIEAILAVPFGTPSVVAAWSWIAILGRSGLLAQWGLHWDLSYSLWAVILAHLFYNTPWVALHVVQAMHAVPEDQLDVARTLGAGKASQFRFVIWPTIRWSVLSSSAQAFSFCTMSFALVMILGGGPPVQTLEAAIYSKLRFGVLDIQGAAACAFWQLLISLLPWAVVLGLRSRQTRSTSIRCLAPRRRQGQWPAFATALIFVLPYFTVFWGSGTIEGREIWKELIPSLEVSLKLGILVATGAVVLGAVAVIGVQAIPSRFRLKEIASLFLALPAGISALSLGLGIWLAYGRWLDPFEGGYWAIAALQATLFFPVVFRSFWAIAQNSPARELEAAATLGASALRAFLIIDWPRWKRPVGTAFGMVLAASIGEVSAVSLFASGNGVPLPLLLSNWMAQYRFEDAQMLAALLFSLSAAATMVLAHGSVAGHRIASENRLFRIGR